MLIMALCCPLMSIAQQNTSSTYSAYGIGDFQSQGLSLNNDLGGLGVALRPKQNLNPTNPASLSALTSATFEAGTKGMVLWQKGQHANETFHSVTLSHLSLGFPIREGLAVSGGLLPYSFQGYDITSTTIQSGESIGQQYTGTGGINRAYLNVGVEVISGLSLGLTGSAFFGQLDQQIDTTSSDGQVLVGRLDDSYSMRAQTIEIGLQYRRDFEDKKVTVGAVLRPETQFDLSRNKSTRIYDATGLNIDTLITEQSEISTVLPMSYVFGLALEKEAHWLVSAEYDFRETSKMYLMEEIFPHQLRNATQMKLGGWWIPDAQDIHNYRNTIQYRAGLNYKSGHLTVLSGADESMETDIHEISVSLGAGLPIKRSKTTANIGLELGRRGAQDAGLVEESFIRFHLAFTFNDNWFSQRKID